MPRHTSLDPARGVLIVEWPLFGELSRGLALKVSRAYHPDVVVGVATAGVVPGAVVAAMLGCDFHSILVSRKYHAETVRDTPAIFGEAPPQVLNRRVLIVDETCDGGDTLRLAISSLQHAGAIEVRTAVCFRTGTYEPDYHALATESAVVLPWDREIIVNDALVPNPAYRELLGA
ncbi:MAG: phosphoribosyltransferase [Gemmatimonadaceae bacterium]